TALQESSDEIGDHEASRENAVLNRAKSEPGCLHPGSVWPGLGLFFNPVLVCLRIDVIGYENFFRQTLHSSVVECHGLQVQEEEEWNFLGYDLLNTLVHLDTGILIEFADTIVQQLINFFVGPHEEVVGAAGAERIAGVRVTTGATVDPIEQAGIVFTIPEPVEDFAGDTFLQVAFDTDVKPPLLGDFGLRSTLGIALEHHHGELGADAILFADAIAAFNPACFFENLDGAVRI